ncbi:MAG TPA: VOC family protein [Noviherbaspirillum sp.]|uniref:VOC family protein n=1 Tax=Noviherbaspirillum sp. TaxID=1926288 RepID=UPI002D611BA5|nr:VOC family protein [Noviherbaspirillum sp.]HYD94359.1 VOC family protein [Noviherbaspirillum sp.]
MQHIDWFEIPSTDFGRASRFYESVFDCELKSDRFGSFPMGIFTSPSGEGVGCVIQGEPYAPGPDGTVIYLNGGVSIDKVLARIEPAGGRVVLGKTELPDNLGYIAHFIDTEGNRLGLHTMA